MSIARHLFCFGLAFTGCVGAPGVPVEECPGLGEEIAGESLNFHAVGHDFDEYCQENFAAAESHADWVALGWGVDPQPFDYWLFETREDACWPCAQGNGTLACATSERVAATTLPHRHEIAHAVRGLPCFPLIEEGWAMLYGDHFEDLATTGDIRAALDKISPSLAGEDYPVATRFVAFLTETRGVTSLRNLCELPSSSIGEFEAAVEAVYGQSFDDLAVEFEEYPEWSLAELRQDQACEGTDVLMSPVSWTFALQCGAPGVEGKQEEWFMTHRLVELPQDGGYEFTIATTSVEKLEMRVELRNCARDGMASSYFDGSHAYSSAAFPEDIVGSDFPAGVYVMRVLLKNPPLDGAELQVSVAPWP